MRSREILISKVLRPFPLRTIGISIKGFLTIRIINTLFTAFQDENGKTGALMMTRSIECCGRKVLRIVDYIGDQILFSGLGKRFKTLIKENGYEYIDFYTFGFNEGYILDAGFKLRTDYDPNIFQIILNLLHGKMLTSGCIINSRVLYSSKLMVIKTGPIKLKKLK